MAQAYVGLFFLGAGYLKATRALFGDHRHSLHDIFLYWLSIDWPVHAFRPFMEWGVQHADTIAVLMIAGQVTIGLMLIGNVRTRLAGAMLFAVHILVLLSTDRASTGLAALLRGAGTVRRSKLVPDKSPARPSIKRRALPWPSPRPATAWLRVRDRHFSPA